MFENIVNFFKGLGKNKIESKSKDAAKERLHLVLMQDRANISADFLALMKQEIIEVIKKYIDVDENAIDVRLTNKSNDDGTTGAPVLYANIPVLSVKEEAKEEARKVKSEKLHDNKNDANSKETKKVVNKKVKKSEIEPLDDLSEDEPISKEINTKSDKDLDIKTNEVIEKAEEIVEEINEENVNN